MKNESIIFLRNFRVKSRDANQLSRREKSFARWDILGSVLSTLCAIHCLAMPILAGVLPLIGLGILGNRTFELAACAGMVTLAAFCLWLGCLRHRRWWLLALLGLGATTVIAVQLAAAPACCSKERGGNWMEATLMFLGGSAIAVSHLLNLHFRRNCGCGVCLSAKEMGAHASRVPVRASRPNSRHLWTPILMRENLCNEVFGAPPKTTRRRRVLPIFRFRNKL